MNMDEATFSFFATNSFWAFVALVLFLLVLVYCKVPAWINNNLDGRAKRIAKELDEAQRLREEAQQLLVDYQRKYAEAEQDAEEMIAAAKRKAQTLADEAVAKSEAYIEQRKKAADDKINQAERTAIKAVRAMAVDMAIKAAEKIIANDLDKKTAEKIFETSLEEIKTGLNS